MQAPMVYELRKPKHIEPGKSYPALFVMHGIGSNEKNMLSIVEGLEEQFYIFSIRGHLSHPPGYSYFTIIEYGKPHRDVFDEGIKKLTSFIDFVSEEYPVNKSQLYLLGFSQGAILSLTLGLTLGNRIKGIVALSGYIPYFVKEEYNIQPVNQVSVFISHGEFDQNLPFEWGKENNEFYKAQGANITFKTYPEGHTVSQQNYEDFRKWLQDRIEK